MNTHIISGEEKSSGRRFFISVHPSPTRLIPVYAKVPHRKFATVMTKAAALAHCHELVCRYPGNTYHPTAADRKGGEP